VTEEGLQDHLELPFLQEAHHHQEVETEDQAVVLRLVMIVVVNASKWKKMQENLDMSLTVVTRAMVILWWTLEMKKTKHQDPWH
jgi:hypothetical protein